MAGRKVHPCCDAAQLGLPCNHNATNDPQAPYIRESDLKATDEQCMEYFANEMEKKHGEQPKREPLMSEAEVERMFNKHDYRDEMDAMKELWRFYENEITEGRLMVVKTVKGTILPNDEWYCEPTLCNTCGTKSMSELNGAYLRPECCTKCGAKIAE